MDHAEAEKIQKLLTSCEQRAIHILKILDDGKDEDVLEFKKSVDVAKTVVNKLRFDGQKVAVDVSFVENLLKSTNRIRRVNGKIHEIRKIKKIFSQ